jgi:hypothetical protein
MKFLQRNRIHGPGLCPGGRDRDVRCVQPESDRHGRQRGAETGNHVPLNGGYPLGANLDRSELTGVLDSPAAATATC